MDPTQYRTVSDEDDFELLELTEDEQQDKEDHGRPEDREDGAKKKRRKRRRGALRQILLALFYLLIILGVLYLGTVLYLWVDERAQDNASQMGAESGTAVTEETVQTAEAPAAAEAEDLSPYTQEDLDEAYEAGVEEGRKSVLKALMESLSNGTSTLSALRPFYPDRVLVVSKGAFHFVKINDELKKCTLLQENFQRTEEGELQYIVNDEVISHKGIDVSSHQGKIEWDKVAASGVEYAIIRVLFRGYGSGALVEDEYFDANMAGAVANGIHPGAYVFTQAITEEEMLEEANLAIQKVSAYSTGCPIVIDVERVAGAEPRMDALTPTERTDLVLLFCKTVLDAGYQPYIYFNTEMSVLYLELERLEDIPKWYASYSDELFFPYEFSLYQYADTGRIDGVKGDVDMDLCFDPFW